MCYPETYSSDWEEKLFSTLEANPTSKDQFWFISSIPNFHKWMWESGKAKSDLKFEQRFSTSRRYHPGSPRNRIINAYFFEENKFEIIHACVSQISGADVKVPYNKKQRRKVNNSLTV